MPKDPKKMDKKAIEEGLEAIYGGEEKVDFTKMERARGRLTQILLTIVLTLAAAAIISWAAYFVYSKYIADTSEESFVVTIEVPETTVSGEKTQIAIAYQNPGSVPLASLELDVRLPTTFVIEQLEPTPANIDDLIWSIGNLGANSEGLILIEGTWIAEVPSSTPIQVLANYRPANFNADFQDIETIYVDTQSSAFDVSFTGPEETVPGETVAYEMTVQNTSSQTLRDGILSLALPQGFFLDKSEPTLEAGMDSEWELGEMLAGETKKIQIEGTFAADVSGFQYFDVILGVHDESRILTQTTAQGFTDVLGSDLTVQLIVNGSAEDVQVGLGDSLRITMAYENTGETEIEGVDLLLDFQSDASLPILWSQADLAGGKITSEGIAFSASTIGPIAAGEKRLLNLVFPIATSVGSGQADSFPVVAHASYGTIEMKSTPITVMINSEAQLLAAGRYYTDDGAPLGNGPLPPKVGEKTSYRIYWTIENSLHDLENVTVTATLPPSVSWEETSAAELGTVSYNDENRTVTWRLTTLPTTIDRVQMNFTVSVIPDTDDVGKFVKLTSESILSATDVVTKSSLESTVEGVTSELIGDRFAEGKGAVVE